MTPNGTTTRNKMVANKQMAILTFLLADQEYGLPIQHVVQIIEMVAIVKLPRLPEHIQGIINFHGQVMPVVDVRLCLGLPFQPYQLHTPVILVYCEQQFLALVVDEVVTVKEATTAVIPATTNNTLLTGIAQIAQQFIPLLNLAALLTIDDQAQLMQLVDNQTTTITMTIDPAYQGVEL